MNKLIVLFSVCCFHVSASYGYLIEMDILEKDGKWIILFGDYHSLENKLQGLE